MRGDITSRFAFATKRKKKERKKEKSGSIMEQPVFITMIKKLVACESQPEALRVFPDTLG